MAAHPSENNVMHYLLTYQLFPRNKHPTGPATRSLTQICRDVDSQIAAQKKRFRNGGPNTHRLAEDPKKARSELSLNLQAIAGASSKVKKTLQLANFEDFHIGRSAERKTERKLRSLASRGFSTARLGAGTPERLKTEESGPKPARPVVGTKDPGAASHLKLFSIKRDLVKLYSEPVQATPQTERGFRSGKNFKLKDISHQPTLSGETEILNKLSSRAGLRADNTIGLGRVQYKPKKGIQLSNLSPRGLAAAEEAQAAKCAQTIDRYFREKVIGADHMDNARLRRFQVLKRNQAGPLRDILKKREQLPRPASPPPTEGDKRLVPNEDFASPVKVEKEKVVAQKRLANEVFNQLKQLCL